MRAGVTARVDERSMLMTWPRKSRECESLWPTDRYISNWWAVFPPSFFFASCFVGLFTCQPQHQADSTIIDAIGDGDNS